MIFCGVEIAFVQSGFIWWPRRPGVQLALESRSYRFAQDRGFSLAIVEIINRFDRLIENNEITGA